VTAKQNAKGTKQWFVGYKAHLAVDDFGVPLSYALTGACVHVCFSKYFSPKKRWEFPKLAEPLNHFC